MILWSLYHGHSSEDGNRRKLGYEEHLCLLSSGVCLTLTASLGGGLGCVIGLDCSAGFPGLSAPLPEITSPWYTTCVPLSPCDG